MKKYEPPRVERRGKKRTPMWNVWRLYLLAPRAPSPSAALLFWYSLRYIILSILCIATFSSCFEFFAFDYLRRVLEWATHPCSTVSDIVTALDVWLNSRSSVFSFHHLCLRGAHLSSFCLLSFDHLGLCMAQLASFSLLSFDHLDLRRAQPSFVSLLPFSPTWLCVGAEECASAQSAAAYGCRSRQGRGIC